MGLWTWGCGFGIVEVVSVGLWVCGGWPVRAWQCLAMGLLGWGCGFGIVEVGCAVGLLQTKEKKRVQREEKKKQRMNNKKKRKGEREMNKK